MRLSYRQIFILPTRFGWMLGLLMAGMLVGSLNFNNNLGLFTTFIVAGLAIHSMLLAWRNLHEVIVQGGQARPVFAGQMIQYHVSFAAGDKRMRPALVLKQGKRVESFFIPPEGPAEAMLPIPAHHRGWLKPGRLQLETTYPTGLFRAWSWFWAERPVLVWPRPASYPPPLPEIGNRRQGGTPRHRSEGEDFHSLRPWREGDPLHRIAWKASQRHQELLSREFREERSPQLFLDLEHTPGNDLEQRISILTAWVLKAERSGRTWTLRLMGSETGPASGKAHLEDCLRQLAEL